jgi:hypothetical protein
LTKNTKRLQTRIKSLRKKIKLHSTAIKTQQNLQKKLAAKLSKASKSIVTGKKYVKKLRKEAKAAKKKENKRLREVLKQL